MTAIMTRDFEADYSAATPIIGDLGHASGGMLAGTKVATSLGWRPVQAVAAGDLVLTFDNGMQRVSHVQTHILDLPQHTFDAEDCPLYVPAGALGNLADLIVMPGQSVLVESDLAEDMLGDAFVAVSASALVGIDGIRPVLPADRFTVVTLHFARDEAIFGAGGVLFVCAGRGDMMQDLYEARSYPVLPEDMARMIVQGGVLPAGSVGDMVQADTQAA